MHVSLSVCVCAYAPIRAPSLTPTHARTNIQTGNHIGAEGAKAVAEALRGNTALTTLDLSGEWKRERESVGGDARLIAHARPRTAPVALCAWDA